MDDLRVPIDEIKAFISFDKDTRIEGTVYLHMVQWDKPLASKVSAFLEDSKEFVPFLIEGTKKTELVNKRNIKTVEWEEEETRDDEFPDTSHKQEVTLFFIDNDSVSGPLISQTTPGHTRLSDCLNNKEGFIHITNGKRHIHVNKSVLLRVTGS